PTPTPTPTLTPTPTPTASPTPTPTPTPLPRFINLSGRGRAEIGNNVLIGGFVVDGTATRRFVLRAMAPSLTAFGVQGVMSDPMLEVYDDAGALIAQNDNWRTGARAAELSTLGLAPTDDREAAVVLDLAAGAYTAILRGANGAQGVGIVEAYEAQTDGTMTARLVNISLRGRVQTGDNVLIGGVAVRGDGPRRVLVRALGPSLGDYAIPTTLADPMLRVFDATGTLVASNDNWRSAQQAAIQATGLAPRSDFEAALIVDLPPGNYTVIVSGQGNSVGIALLELYDLPDAARPERVERSGGK
ncbi:MAG: hypothetical protein JSR82_13730, partial [Verrucomicrobia bacterium]|nr:hypothetical protein [Verrucomicrobiota bacterium]